MAESNIQPSHETENTEIQPGASEMSTDSGTDSGMDRFLQKTRSELMNELRRIEHGERPVTGTDSRNNINQFLAKHQETPAGSEGKENVPANVDRVEEHRPESVVVEVQGLFEQQRVSSMLQSTMFRRSLERIIRNSITSATGSNLSSTRVTPARNATPPVPAQETRSRAQSEESVLSAAVSSSSSTSSTSRVPSPVVQPGVPSPVVQHGVWVPVQDHPDGVVPPRDMPTWQDIAQIQREEMVQDISDLLHQRLVTSTLEGEFRGTLEVQMQNHLASSGNNGQDVVNVIRNLPNTAHLRNDFSHLGLAQPQDNWDNISVTSVSATAVPYTQSNLHLSREIRSLKNQMEEMKNMLKLSFDLQLDIQRAIRQEVAGAIAQATASQGASAAPVTIPKSKPVSDTHCLICLENHADSVLYQCGHMCLCFTCGKHLVSMNGKCPVCRAPIRDVIRAYKCNED